MVKYRAYEVELSYNGTSILARGTVVRRIDGGEWVVVDTFTISVPLSRDSKEIAKNVLQTVRNIARKDFVVNTILVDADARIEAHIFDFDTEP